nr:uncharacterized protein LOC128698475 isoform X3 [Cherax quadricarinatus]
MTGEASRDVQQDLDTSDISGTGMAAWDGLGVHDPVDNTNIILNDVEMTVKSNQEGRKSGGETGKSSHETGKTSLEDTLKSEAKALMGNVECDNEGEGGAARVPDGGWGWLVVFGSFIITLLVPLLGPCFGVLFSSYLLEAGSSSATTAWIFNVQCFIWNMMGLIVRPLVKEFGWRNIAFQGILLTSASVIMSAFAPSPVFLFFSFSLLSVFPLLLEFELRWLMVTMAVWGCGIGTTMGLYTLVMIKFMGLENLGAVYGASSLTVGFGFLSIGPLIELDVTKDDPELYAPVNIGFPTVKTDRKEQLGQRLQHIRVLRENPLIEKKSRIGTLEADLEKVQAVWETFTGPHHIRTLAEHYGIFRDLYGNAYFIPSVILKIFYDFDEETVTPVYRGNTVKPREAAKEPMVEFQSQPDDLWTLILTNPDGNLLENEIECLHWFIGNIKGGDITTGEVICDYLQPFPPRGTGYHRLVFVLYKQDGYMDYSTYKKQQPCLSLKERTFSTLSFYRELQDNITPAGLSWFQSDWDSSLTDFFHHTLKMREPVYEYDFPKPYLAPQKYFPLRRQFNTYLDLHRDPKEINKEILLQRLKNLNPLEPEPPVLPFPGAQSIPKDLTTWERRDLKRKRLGVGKYRNLFRGSNRPNI